MKNIFVFFIRIYQGMISPLLGNNCRYMPSCSQYTIEAMEEWGAWKGMRMGLRRMGRCHPWGSHGVDPVPRNPLKSTHQ